MDPVKLRVHISCYLKNVQTVEVTLATIFGHSRTMFGT
jgi:hypothetical protein